MRTLETFTEVPRAAGVRDDGECDEYGFSFAQDPGVPLIETGHALSENPGVRPFAARLDQELAGLKTVFHPDTSPFAVV